MGRHLSFIKAEFKRWNKPCVYKIGKITIAAKPVVTYESNPLKGIDAARKEKN